MIEYVEVGTQTVLEPSSKEPSSRPSTAVLGVLAAASLEVTAAAPDSTWPPQAPLEEAMEASRPVTSTSQVPKTQGPSMLTPPRTAATQVHLDDTSDKLSDKLGALAAASVVSAVVQAEVETQAKVGPIPAIDEDVIEMGLMPALAAVPELIHVANIDVDDAEESLKFIPAHCQVDVGTRQLRLVLLGPVGSPQKIALQSISNISQPQMDGFTPHIDIEIGSGEQKPLLPGPTRKVRLASADELCASALMAALNAPHRNMPGSSLATPQSSACGGFPTPRHTHL